LIMFLLVATALAAGGTTNIGFPCQRLNWGWRNVWSTCSISSYIPNGATTDAVGAAPNAFLRSSAPSITATSAISTTTGVYTPTANTVPTQLCTAASNTGTGTSAGLRNRCRRALDAYGALVVQCAAPAGTAIRGPNTLATPDWAPSQGHAPHSANVQGLTWNAQMCIMPTGAYTPANLNSPSNTCPGLLGWFTVVYSACKFTQAPGLSNAPSVATNLVNYFPIGSTTVGVAGVTSAVLNGATVTGAPNGRAGYFCAAAAPNGANAPSGWNDVGANFRSSRCRKALDQFGRTAKRCDASAAPMTGPAQAGGYSDPLRLLAVGVSGGAPIGINSWAPACN
jgi:hypothetical protein